MTADFWSSLISFLLGALGLDILIAVHETGHYFAAQLCKIKVESVSFGFGPVLFRWNKNNTQFKICLIPFGGATRLAGRKDLLNALYNNDKRIVNCEEGSLYKTKPIKRIITYLAGPLANILFAIICYTVLLIIPTVSRTLPAKIQLTENSPAGIAGLESGDVIRSINGREVKDYFEMRLLLEEANKDEFAVISTDYGTYNVHPVDNMFGILPGGEYENKTTNGKNFSQALSLACRECISDTQNFIESLLRLFKGKNKVSETIGGTFSASESIGVIATHSFKSSINLGIRTVLYLMASVSISLAFANLLPITALDGGLILISVIEMITRRTWSPKVYIALQGLGLAVLFIVIPVVKFFF